MIYTIRSCFIHLMVLMLGALAAGCSTRSYVSATGSTPAQFTHVYLTTQEVWFNSSATAGPDGSGWAKFPLKTPVTVDLVTLSNATLSRIVGGLRLSPLTYSQLRLIPVDAATTLTESAQTAGAIYNQEVDYVDSTGVAHQIALELPNPDKGIGIQGTLKVPFGSAAPIVGAAATGANTDITDSSTTTTTSPTSLGTTTNVDFAFSIDGASDIAMFTYGTQIGAVLSSHATAYTLSQTGGISGTLTLTNLGGYNNISARVDISATAESLSADGTRHVVVASAPVNADGSFLLYPLPASTSTTNPTTYDVVIHGPSIQTMVIKGVQVTRNSSSDNSNTTDIITSGTANTSVGTLIPQAATSSYAANINPSTTSILPAGAVVDFYQTLSGSNEVPYVIEERAIDPFNRTLQTDVTLSVAPIESGSFVLGTQAITLTSAAPAEGAGIYTVAAHATAFADGALNAALVPSTSTGTTAQATPAALSATTGATLDTLTATVTQRSAGAYDRGELIVTHDGAVVATTALDSVLAQSAGGTVTVSGIPGGSAATPFNTGLYYLAVRAWKSTDPAGTLVRQSYPATIDLSNGNATGIQIVIN